MFSFTELRITGKPLAGKLARAVWRKVVGKVFPTTGNNSLATHPTSVTTPPCFTDILMQVNHFLIPVMQDDYSIISGIEFYQLIEQTIRPVSRELVDANLFFNRIPRVHKIGGLLDDLRKHFDFFPFFLNNYVCYERAFRSTIFPIPMKRMEAIKLMEFIQRTQAIWEKNQTKVNQALAVN